MKMNELRQKSREELTGLLDMKRSRVEELSWLLATKKVKNVKESAGVKKDIARILTILNIHNQKL